MSSKIDALLRRIADSDTLRVEGRVASVTGLTIRAVLPDARLADVVRIERRRGSPLLAEIVGFEREVAVLIAQGLSNGEIADKLVLSKRTVEKHIGGILSKLGMTNRAQIVRWAIEQDLLKDSPSQ